MKSFLLVALAIAGCSSAPTRDPAVDARGPIVNPLAPGAKGAGNHSAPVAGELYKAPAGMKTGIPK